MKHLLILIICINLAYRSHGLIIVSPPSVAGSYDSAITSLFGTLPKPPPGITAPMVLMKPEKGCTEAENAPELNGKIAVIKRGQCFFMQKIKNAQIAGAIAVVMINHNPDYNENGGITEMSGHDPEITIPRYFNSILLMASAYLFHWRPESSSFWTRITWRALFQISQPNLS